MTNTPTHYFNFKPCDEVVQYIEINRFEVTRVANYYSYGVIGDELVLTRKAAPNIFIRLGQWLIRQDGKVWVQDEEPARVERWGYAYEDKPGRLADDIFYSLDSVRAAFADWAYLPGVFRRPVVTVGDQEWLGPWEVVDE